MNAVPMVAGDPLMEEWASMIVCRYNGCCSSSATCTERRRKYRDNAIMLYQEFGGAAFWGQVEAPTCAPIPAEGRVVEEREAGCYAAAGAPQFWRQVADGHGGSLEWTMTIDRATPSNHATWALDFAKAGRYRVDVHLDGGVYGQSRQARYVVRHGGQDTEVVIDQTQGTGFVPLGEFDFAAGPDQQVNLGDNTGEAGAMTRLLFDAIQVVPVGGNGPGPDPDDGGDTLGDAEGGCTTGRGTGWAGLLLGGIALARRRRRR